MVSKKEKIQFYLATMLLRVEAVIRLRVCGTSKLSERSVFCVFVEEGEETLSHLAFHLVVEKSSLSRRVRSHRGRVVSSRLGYDNDGPGGRDPWKPSIQTCQSPGQRTM